MSTDLLIMFVTAWLILAIAELTTHFFIDCSGVDYPADPYPSDTDEDADDLPFGPAPADNE